MACPERLSAMNDTEIVEEAGIAALQAEVEHPSVHLPDKLIQRVTCLVVFSTGVHEVWICPDVRPCWVAKQDRNRRRILLHFAYTAENRLIRCRVVLGEVTFVRADGE